METDAEAHLGEYWRGEIDLGYRRGVGDRCRGTSERIPVGGVRLGGDEQALVCLSNK